MHHKQVLNFYNSENKIMPKIILKINQTSDKIYDDEKICCYVAESSLPLEFIKKIAAKGKMVLLSGGDAVSICKDSDFDGVLVEISTTQPIKAQINKIRSQLGSQKALGVIIPARRHEAMLASEAEPEFVAFRFLASEKEKAVDIIKWYNELFLIQSAVDLSLGLQQLPELDCDFMIINSQDYKDFGC